MGSGLHGHLDSGLRTAQLQYPTGKIRDIRLSKTQ